MRVLNFVLIALVFSGCAEELQSKKIKSFARLQKQFEMVDVVDDLQLRPLANCDVDAAVTLSEARPSTDAAEIVSTCEKLYSCSDSAKSYITTWSLQRLTFGLGSTSFRKISLTDGFTDKTNGIYFADTHRIYIDSRLSTNYEACSVLLHEMSHRADTNITIKTKPAFETEFPAYYIQQSFAGEFGLKILQKSKNLKLNEFAQSYLQVGRDKLFEEVSQVMPASKRSMKATDFPKFVWE